MSPDLGSRRPSPGSHDPVGHQGVDHEDHDDGEEDEEEETAGHQAVHHDDEEEEEVAGQPAPSDNSLLYCTTCVVLHFYV